MLADGRELWLGDLPLLNKARKPYDAQPPFSFQYGGQPSSEFLGQWKLERESKKLDDQREQHTLSWTDPRSGLCVRCVGVQYHDYPTVEWTIYFKNTGTADSPLIENIQAIDTTFSSGAQGDCILRHHTGDLCTADSSSPMPIPCPLAVRRSSPTRAVGPRKRPIPITTWAGPAKA